MDKNPQTKNTQLRTRRVKMRVGDEEKRIIEENAKLHGMNVSEYLRFVGLNYKPLQIIDEEQLELLKQEHNKMTRLGVLLKAWVFNDPKYALSTRKKIEENLPAILSDIDMQRSKIKSIAETMLDILKAKVRSN